MKNGLTILGIMIVLMIASPTVNSQPCKGGWGQGSPCNQMYDPKTVETIRGEVISVQTISHGKGNATGIHLNLKTASETISVHLGPSWYLENQETQIEMKDQIEVKGSRITYEGKPTIIAAEITKGEQLLKLRDENGFPAWSGWRRKQ